MPAFDDLTSGLKFPMESVSTPSTSRVNIRDEGGVSTDQMLSEPGRLPEDGDTKSADPKSWMNGEGAGKSGPTDKKLLMSLGGLGMQVFESDLPEGKSVANFVDDNEIPIGEIWMSRSAKDTKGTKDELLNDIIYCYLVSRQEMSRDQAKKVADSIGKAMGLFSKTEKK